MTEEMSRVERGRNSTKNNKRPSQPNPKKSGSKWKRILKYTFWTIVILIVVGGFVGAGLFAYYASSAPKVTNSALVGTSQTKFLDKDGDVFYSTGSKRETAKQNEIPKKMRMAVVSIEDRRFYKHHGVDPRRILGAAFANVTGSSLGLQGGSTLTQQLIKLTVFSTNSSDQTLKRKAQEAWLATKLEKQYSKNQILTLYMNKVYMGNGVYGMKTAAEYYFNKDISELTVPQMALLAGLPQSPSGYDPYSNPKGATSRRNDVLKAMANNYVISQSDATKYSQTSIKTGLTSNHDTVDSESEDAKVDDAYITSVRNKLSSLGYDLNKDGLVVQTNLDSDVQQRAYDVANTDDYVAWKDDLMQVGLTVTNPNNGQVMAQIGGRKQNGLQGSNRATNTNRSSGSTAKPLVDYGPAVENLSWSTNHSVDDSAYTYPGTNTQVYDADRSYLGKITMRKALAQSRNIPAIKTLQEVGYDNSSAFLKKLGIPMNSDKLVASSAIGIDVSSEQEAAAFSAFGNGGEYYKPQYISKITDQSGAVKEFKNSSSTAMKSSTAFMLTNMMKSVITDSYAKIINTSDYAQAGKTGVTAYDDSLNMPDKSASDAWFTGFTKTAAISVWTGYDEPNEEGHSLASGEQQFTPLRVYKALMDYIMSGAGADGSDWDMPDTVKSSTVNGVKEYSVVGADTSSEKTIDQAVKKSSSRSTPSRRSSSAQPSSSSEKSTPSSEEPSSSSESSEESETTESSDEQTSSSEEPESSSTSEEPGEPSESSQPSTDNGGGDNAQ
ncbi:PBP1A family penicillin-binding protein [Weissella thailandensis]|uniref:PBP1A family penicillin-binding protein n=1 Tax=Weissella thailandensis TaxID=89061 RepID=A0ABX9I7Z0_9LACO|nr:PBP1A family penicillin-binding protein [Weissella thailandensis]NKY90186.1 PBP1A family penicillin-binding protein [Weissella thailandensis]RDS60263.1 PBP1A family penicillin-binding protein [Weissella thailandensis]GEP74078.1 penicillin-binding protein 1A [Weissella thailandensis]